MTDANDVLVTIKQALDECSKEYSQIVNTFEQSTRDTEAMEEEQKMKVRMDALEIRCKDSQFLLEKIIRELSAESEDQALIKEYENKVVCLLNDIRQEINNNNLLEMIKQLENIPVVMSEIDEDIIAIAQKTSSTIH